MRYYKVKTKFMIIAEIEIEAKNKKEAKEEIESLYENYIPFSSDVLDIENSIEEMCENKTDNYSVKAIKAKLVNEY